MSADRLQEWEGCQFKAVTGGSTEQVGIKELKIKRGRRRGEVAVAKKKETGEITRASLEIRNANEEAPKEKERA